MSPREPDHMQRIQIGTAPPRLRRTALAAVLLGGTALGGYAVGHVALAAAGPGQPVNPPAAQAQQAIPDFVGLVKQGKPAVVSVTTKFAARDASDEGSEEGSNGGPQQLPFPFNQMPFGQMMPHGGGGEGQAV